MAHQSTKAGSGSSGQPGLGPWPYLRKKYYGLPCSRTISLTPWKNPLYLGLGEVWSWMNFTCERNAKALAPRVPLEGHLALWLPAPGLTKIRSGLEMQLFTWKQGYSRPP